MSRWALPPNGRPQAVKCHQTLVTLPLDRPKYAGTCYSGHTLEHVASVAFEAVGANGAGKSKEGYEKLLFCGRQAAKDGLEYFWMDTVCIDKQSSAELTSSLNSMFRWYRESAKCYVYMSDVTSLEPDFSRSVWFTRGWTLQELIAPNVVEFFFADEQCLGDKMSLDARICAITKIPMEAIWGQDLSRFSVEERMRWVQSRTTTLEEDRSYCLLGIFGIFMPVIYGEGNNALERLKKNVRSINVRRPGRYIRGPRKANRVERRHRRLGSTTIT